MELLLFLMLLFDVDIPLELLFFTTLLFDLPAKSGLSRAWQEINTGSRTMTETRFEKEALEFHEKVRQGYLMLARKEPERFKVIDASKTVDEVRADVLRCIEMM